VNELVFGGTLEERPSIGGGALRTVTTPGFAMFGFISRRYVSYRTKKLQMQILDSGPCVCVRCTTQLPVRSASNL
jgi:hypothetical protein